MYAIRSYYDSKNKIVVITDSGRNEIKIDHNNIIDIETPREFNNHQASIYLKTSINKFLEKGNNYCYLDGDIVRITSYNVCYTKLLRCSWSGAAVYRSEYPRVPFHCLLAATLLPAQSSILQSRGARA